MAAGKFGIVVYIPVKVWSCMLCSKDCRLEILRLLCNFGTHFKIFAKSKYYFDFAKSEITLQPSGNEKLCHSPILIGNIA